MSSSRMILVQAFGEPPRIFHGRAMHLHAADSQRQHEQFFQLGGYTMPLAMDDGYLAA